ncbi:Outer membrane efflux protein [Botrimarina colliarenosi]|uniref:Outer membrane efflux protein n=1 Tax=Botrimarina colliarenosi TaxID=2528001 RepID=A0A5C6AAK1_9BACT|nr:TolC family protein [Botrimarina colliarenosi]TWT96071.1 Outer membrane efflux protein [Botrimarina colliarenosi]
MTNRSPSRRPCWRRWTSCWLVGVVAVSGCQSYDPGCTFYDSAAAEVCYTTPAGAASQLTIEQPVSCNEEGVDMEGPIAIDPNTPVEHQDISLEEAIQHALQNTRVMRDLGGVITTPDALVSTVYDPAAQYSNPLSGEEAALSAFDATFAAGAFFEKNDRQFNNSFIGDGGQLTQDLGNANFELRKQAATGTQMFMRHLLESDFNNNVGNRFGSPSQSFQSIVEGEIRQPLLQGAGVQFNRIAGPNAQPGQLNGVLLARTRTDISLAEFESAVRDLVANVENAYWDLYFAYRDLDAKKRARDYALETYESVAVRARFGDEDGTNENIGQALEQYWRYESEVVNAQTGRTLDGTRTGNGSGGGTGRAPVGVRLAERRLRLIIGMPINGGAVLRPRDEPQVAPVSFDWSRLASAAINERPELRAQRWRIKQLELELIAGRNLLLPDLDVVGRYRWRGFGEDLVNQSNQPFSSAYGDLTDGNFQEWQVGVELEVPLGFRRAHTAVRNSEHALARSRAIFKEQKRDVVFGLSNAIADVQRAFAVVQAQYNRFQAAERQIAALNQLEKSGETSIDLKLEAQRRVLDTEILYHQATVDYALALRNVYFETGTLLNYNNIVLAEGASPSCAYADAVDLSQRRTKPLDYTRRDAVISAGPAL